MVIPESTNSHCLWGGINRLSFYPALLRYPSQKSRSWGRMCKVWATQRGSSSNFRTECYRKEKSNRNDLGWGGNLQESDLIRIFKFKSINISHRVMYLMCPCTSQRQRQRSYPVPDSQELTHTHTLLHVQGTRAWAHTKRRWACNTGNINKPARKADWTFWVHCGLQCCVWGGDSTLCQFVWKEHKLDIPYRNLQPSNFRIL